MIIYLIISICEVNMKVQKAISFDIDVLEVLMKECRRENIHLSDYVMEAINHIGPLDYEMARRVRSKCGLGIRYDSFFESRAPKVEVQDDRLESTSTPSVPHQAD